MRSGETRTRAQEMFSARKSFKYEGRCEGRKAFPRHSRVPGEEGREIKPKATEGGKQNECFNYERCR